MNWQNFILTHEEHGLEFGVFRVQHPLLITDNSNYAINLSLATKDNSGKYTYLIPVSMPTTGCREMSSGARRMESLLVLLHRIIKLSLCPPLVHHNHYKQKIHTAIRS